MDYSALRARFHAVRYFKNLGKHIFIRLPSTIYQFFRHRNNGILQVGDPQERLHLHSQLPAKHPRIHQYKPSYRHRQLTLRPVQERKLQRTRQPLQKNDLEKKISLILQGQTAPQVKGKENLSRKTLRKTPNHKESCGNQKFRKLLRR